MKLLKTLLAAAILFQLVHPAQAQDKPRTISGKVLQQSDKEGIPFVNVFLLKPADSTMVKGIAASEKGTYQFEDVVAGSYLVMASMVGFTKTYTGPVKMEEKGIKLPDLVLAAEVQSLNEVKVVAQKPFVEQEVDRMIINVEGSPVSAGSTALEVLERSPGVTVDQQNDKLKLRGKSGVIVQIDGKQSYLSESELVALLRNTPSDNIEKIELITNPSAKYDAAGNSGIINIKFKKNKNYGTNGNFSIGAGMADRRKPRANAMFAINQREGKLSWNATLNGFQGKGFNDQFIQRVIPFEGNNTTFNSVSKNNWKATFYSYKLGVDYYLNSKTTLGAMFSGFSNRWESPLRESKSDIFDNDLVLKERFKTSIATNSGTRNYTANVNLKHQFNDKGKELSFDVDYVRYDRSDKNLMNTLYTAPDGSKPRPDELLRTNMPSIINIGVAKLDYTQPIGKGKFEAGLKSSYVKADNDMLMEIFADKWQVDLNRTNRFKYTENINAAYANFNGKFSEKTKYQVGLRAEHTHSIGNSVTLNKVTDRNYVNVFPSAFISQTLDSNNVLNLSYSYRLDRPNYQSLNPFEFYLDPYTFQRGNPNLRPQYTHSFQLVHVFKNFLNTTLAYSRITDVIAEQVPQIEAEKNFTYVTNTNLDNQNYFSLIISAPIPVTKWWNLQLNGSTTYNSFKTFYRNAFYDVSILSYNLYGNNTIKLPKEWSVEAGGWVDGPNIYGLVRSSTMGAFSLGVQKNLWDKKGSIKLNVQDPLAKNRFKGETHFEDINLNIYSRWPSRQVRLTFSYRFGNQNVKTRQRSTGSDDLQQRVGGGQN
ncbi:outer membrane beta-barrel family protein [Ravibacter arvi]|uniref:Outer membrane beta-barrel family protein n=1 Tax=Ravibacter arvi TaxID=2051041 RepID=A0ABP8LJV9_9BACT